MKGIKINGVSAQISGNGSCVVINGNRITVNGKEVSNLDKINEKEIYIVIEGDVSNLEIDYCEKVEVGGNVESVNVTSGSVHVANNVNGDIGTVSGAVKVGGSISGNAETVSGAIKVEGSIGGNASTVSGAIHHR